MGRHRRPSRLLFHQRIPVKSGGDREPGPHPQRDSRLLSAAEGVCLCLRNHRSDVATDRHSRRFAQPVPDPASRGPDSEPGAYGERCHRLPLGRDQRESAADQQFPESSPIKSASGISISRSQGSAGTAASISLRAARPATFCSTATPRPPLARIGQAVCRATPAGARPRSIPPA